MLLRVSRSPSALTRRAATWLLLVGALACALPTVEIAPAAAEPEGAKAADGKLTGKIFLTVTVRADDKFPTDVIAVDPATGKWERICDAAGSGGVRVAPNRETLGFGRGADGIWTAATQKDSSPARVFERGHLAGWSPDSKQIIVKNGKFEEGTGWKHETWRMNVNGTEVTTLPIPETDGVHDWSPDGKWVVTVSDRHEPKGSGYQLYVMKPDGTEERRITQGRGLNVYARFSPDSRKVVYLHQEKGVNSVWTVNIDGTGATRVLEEKDLAGIDAACWSPSGKQLVVLRFDWERDDDGKKILRNVGGQNHRLEIIDADGKNVRELKLVDLEPVWVGHPEWR